MSYVAPAFSQDVVFWNVTWSRWCGGISKFLVTLLPPSSPWRPRH